jgi:hypothetical protein
MTRQASFEAIADRLLSEEPGVEEGTGFGSSPGLRVNGKIFAMLVVDELVVKLPATRCTQLVSTDAARPFDRGQGRPLKEWVTVGGDAEHGWVDLAQEALAFVRSSGTVEHEGVS